jgi:catecholate siderophore receptor
MSNSAPRRRTSRLAVLPALASARLTVSVSALALCAMASTAPAVAQEAEPTLPEIEVVAPPEADLAAAPKPAKKPAAKKPKAAAKKPAPDPALEPDVLPPEDADALAAGGAAGGPTGPGADVPGMPGTGTTGIDGYTARGTSTATKTNTPLIDIPQSITVVTKKQAEDRGSFTVGEVLRYVPGIAVAQGEGHRDQITIRGQNTTADFFVDGVRDDIEYFRDIYNVEAIEVLKGPAAMIFGRGGGGGVVNRVTKKADGERIREATVTLGSFERARTTIDVGDKISPDAAFRLNAMYEDSESFRDFFELERYGINPTMAFRLSDQTKVSMSYEYFSDERTTDRGVPSLNGRPFRGPIESFYGNPDESQSDFAGHTATATIEHRTDFGLNLRNHSFYANYEKFYSNVYAASPVNDPAAGPGNYLIEGYSMGTDRETFVNQTDATYRWDMGNGIRHTLLAGTEISFQDTTLPRDRVVFDPEGDGIGAFPYNNSAGCVTANGFNCRRLIVPVANPTDFTPLEFANVERRWATDVATYSGYIQDQLEITDYFEIIAGLRFDRFDVSAVNSTNPASVVNLDRVDDVWSHRVGAVFKPTDKASVYIATSTSFLPGVGDQFINLAPQAGVTVANLEPEEFQNNEIGFKWEVAPRLFFTGAIFELERSNQIVTAGPAIGEQVGLTRTRGGELALTGYITDEWQISAGWGHQIARIVEAGSNVGNEVPFVPNNIYSLWNRYQFLPWLGAGLGIIHQDSSFAEANNNVELPSFTRVDAAFFFDINENWAAQINVENVLDEEYFASAHNNNNISPGAPRQAFVTVRARF